MLLNLQRERMHIKAVTNNSTYCVCFVRKKNYDMKKKLAESIIYKNKKRKEIEKGQRQDSGPTEKAAH